MSETESIGKYREVGKPRPHDGIYILKTPEDRAEYFERLAHFQERNAMLCPVSRIFGLEEPRVKRFRTHEEANADHDAAKIRLARWLGQQRHKVF